MAPKTKWRIALVCVVLAANLEKAIGSQQLMKDLTIGFAKGLDACKKELNLPDHVMEDFANFWKEDYSLVNRELGCAIMCMSMKFDLMSEDLKMHHGKAHAFAVKHGADDDTAKQIVAIIHECEKQFPDSGDDCARVLEVAKCFRTKIHGLKWAPSMEEIVAEIMLDM